MRTVFLYMGLMLITISGYPCASNFYATQDDYTSVTIHWTNDSCPAGTHLHIELKEAQQNILGVYAYAPLASNEELVMGSFFLNTENSVDGWVVENPGIVFQRWSFSSLAAPPGALPNHFLLVESRSVNVGWWSNGASGQINPLGTPYEFHFSTSASFENPLVQTHSDLVGNFITQRVGCLSPQTTYYARMRAFNPQGIPSDFLILGSTVTLPDTPPSPVYSWAGGLWGLSVSPLDIYSSEDSMIFNGSPLESPLLSPSLPAQIVVANNKLSENGGSRRRPLPNGLAEIQASRACPAQFEAELEEPATVTYNFTSNAGWVESGVGPVREETLSFYRLDLQAGLWNKVPSRVEGGQVTATITELGTLAVMGQEDVSLQNLRVSPNPLHLGSDTDVTFANMAEQATLRIFTASGREVRRLEETDGDGVLRWDGKNSSGESVSPGVYLYHVQSPGAEKKGKVMVLR